MQKAPKGAYGPIYPSLLTSTSSGESSQRRGRWELKYSPCTSPPKRAWFSFPQYVLAADFLLNYGELGSGVLRPLKTGRKSMLPWADSSC